MVLLKKAKIIFAIIIAIILFLFLAVVILSLIYPVNETKVEGGLVAELKKQKKHELSEENNYFLGAENSKITIIEFADFSCPACKSTHLKLRNIIFNYAKYVKVVFKDFPVVSEDSLSLAMAGRCAGEQGLFWLMHDELFENQGRINNEKLIQISKQIGLAENQFNNCLQNEKYLADIKKDYALGEKLNITGTPTLFINGYKLAGDIPEEILVKIIEEFITYQ